MIYKQSQYLSIKNKAALTQLEKPNLFLSISTAIIILPLMIPLMLLSLVVSNRQWNNFWDEFLG